MALSTEYQWPPAGGVTQAQVTAAIQAVFPDDILGPGVIQDASSVNITTAFLEMNASAAIPSGTKALQVSSIVGEPIEISVSDTAVNAASATQRFVIVPGGGPVTMPVIAAAGTKVFVKSRGSLATSGYLTCNFLG